MFEKYYIYILAILPTGIAILPTGIAILPTGIATYIRSYSYKAVTILMILELLYVSPTEKRKST